MNKKIVWITGGAKGLGSELSKVFVNNNYKVIASSSKKLENYILGNFIDKSILENENFEYLKCDIRNYYEIIDTVNYIIKKYNKIDILINNAGISKFKPFLEHSIEEIEEIFNINFKGAIYSIKNVLPFMLTNKSGLICNISSVAVIENFTNCSIYNASKSALLSFSRTLRNEIRGSGIKIFDIILGATNTNIWDEISRIKYSDKMINPFDVAKIVFSNIDNILNSNFQIEEIIIKPQNGNI